MPLREDLYAIERVLMKGIYVLLTSRKEYFDEQQSHPEKKAVSGKPVLWRRDQFSQLQLKPVQKLKV